MTSGAVEIASRRSRPGKRKFASTAAIAMPASPATSVAIVAISNER